MSRYANLTFREICSSRINFLNQAILVCEEREITRTGISVEVEEDLIKNSDYMLRLFRLKLPYIIQ